MKRGKLGLSLLFSILLIPFVSAATDDVLDILIGSSESSMIFLRFMYGALIFIIFLSVTKKTVFKSESGDNQTKKLGNIFSLIIAIFATRFTPDPVVQNFGWVIMFLTPLIIYYTIFGIFTRKKTQTTEDKETNFSWIRFILAFIATLFTLSALGQQNYLGGFPFIGGGLNELFFDINYLLFDKYLIILILLGIILALASRFIGKNKEGDSTIPGGILAALLILLLILGLASLFGGIGLPGLGWLKYLLLGTGILALLLLLIRLFPSLLGLIRRIPLTPTPPSPSDRIRIDLTANGRTVNSNGFTRRALQTEPGVPLLITVKASVRRRFWSNQPIPNANLNFSVTTGTIPRSATTDATGSTAITFNPPPGNSTAYLIVQVNPTPISGAFTSPRFPIEILSQNNLRATIVPSNIIVDVGNPATINVNVRDRNGRNVNGATVIVDFAGALIPSITRTSNATGLATIVTPALTTARTHNFTATITHPNFPSPCIASGTITVRNPRTPDLDVRINRPTIPATVNVGDTITVEFFVSERGATPTIPINSARFDVSPRAGTPGIGISRTGVTFYSGVRRNTSVNGTYTLTISPTNAQAGNTITFSVRVSNRGYNDNNFTFDIIVPALPAMTITPTFPATMFARTPVALQVAVTDPTGTNVNATLRVNFTTGGSTPAPIGFTRNSSGIYVANFTPPSAGTFNFTFEATHPRFTNATLTQTVVVNALPAPSLTCFLLWAPLTSNHYQLLQTRIIDNNTGNPINGANVSFSDAHSNRVNITGTLVTTATGNFPTAIRFQPLRTVSAREEHNITVSVSATGYPTKTHNIRMIFDPPSAPLVGIGRSVF